MIWIVLALMTLVALALLATPTLIGRSRTALRRAEFDLAVYRDQLAEVDRDVGRGLIGADEARAARTEIQRRIFAAGEEDPGANQPAEITRSRQVLVSVVVLAILIPAAGLPLYWKLGYPGLPGQPFAARQVALEAHREEARHNREKMAELVERLAERMKAEPDQQEGWLLLGRSYRTLDLFAQSAEAFRRALALGPAPGVLSQLGEVLVLDSEGAVGPEALEALQKAVAEDPGDIRARFYLEAARMQGGDL